MLMHEIPELRQQIADQLMENPVLIPEHGVGLRMPKTFEDADAISAIYRAAYDRGDFFAGRYASPQEQIFNPAWLAQDFKDNPDHLWFVFTNKKAQIVGSTGFFHDTDGQSAAVLTSDETQIMPSGRGMRTMDYFFERIVPQIEQFGIGLSTDFVLSPETKGLRRTLQTNLGMVALGIHPHILRHPDRQVTRSEISAAKYPSLVPKVAHLLSEFEPLYSIVRSQLPALLVPELVSARVIPEASNFSDEYTEMRQTVDASDVRAQKRALKAGFLPVAYDPSSNSFRMARLPKEEPDLSFILDNEQVESNKQLVEYMHKVLYKSNDSGDRPGRS